MEEKSERQIKILNAEVARKIAAGEVIDRPNATLRELLDNAVDSGATQIDVEIFGGGIEKIRVADNGCGMSKENLLAAAHPHATSKISTESDLLNLSTLGFRGEALASIAAVSRLTIASGAYKMRCSITEDHLIEPSQNVEGTIVTSENLFENFPARRQFLKRPASETKMCRSTFLEKSLARTDIAFRLSVDGEIRSDLSAGQTLAKRFVSALEIRQSADLFYELKGNSANGEWNFKIVIGDPSISRPDRKDIFIYVNGRRISEYSLLQAIEYGAQGCFPNGTHPVAALFVEMRPDLVDFNIHPAKREARFKDIAQLHHGVSSTLREFFRAYTIKTMKEQYSTPFLAEAASNDSANFSEKKNSFESSHRSDAPQIARAFFENENPEAKNIFTKKRIPPISKNFSSANYSSSIGSRPSFLKVAEPNAEKNSAPRDFHKSENSSPENSSIPSARKIENENSAQEYQSTFFPKAHVQGYEFRYIGCTLGTFILIEKNSALYAIDQHAAHERFLFDKIMGGKSETQKLLIPLKIALDSDEDERQMEALAPQLFECGFSCEKISENEWQFTTLNSLWKGDAQELKKLLFERGVEPREIIRKIAAMTACKAAVKDGYILDDAAAEDLAKKALDLPDPHCPHGRPVYTVLTREKLFALVKRT
ncbi:MAG: DNA mismatch repair endonuclease MutL [Treponemataceae bacterium]|nr:DNA mismatch repair endonuclease MutL [Treponemataceae bacterium]